MNRHEMTLNEAIIHAEEVAEAKLQDAELSEIQGCYNNAKKCVQCAEEHKQLAKWLKDYKRLLEQEPRWIPVREKLPEESIAVLVWCPERKNIYCAYYEEKQWWIFGAYFEKITLDVIAWMPLPKPYKAESEG